MTTKLGSKYTQKIKFEVGDRVIWYDHRLWGPKDYNHNEHCYVSGTIVKVYLNETYGEPVVDILFDHSPNVSHGHFNHGIYQGKKIVKGDL